MTAAPASATTRRQRHAGGRGLSEVTAAAAAEINPHCAFSMRANSARR
jgi:hypothetical protein